jgi:hypothetical protein
VKKEPKFDTQNIVIKLESKTNPILKDGAFSVIDGY